MFTFYSSICNILFVFVQTLVIIEFFPKLIESKYKSNDFFRKEYTLFKSRILKISVIGFLLSIIGIYPLLVFMDRTILFNDFYSYLILLFGMFVFCLSHSYHYALYAYNKDNSILWSLIIAFMANLILSFILIPLLGVLGASLSQSLSFFMLYILKRYFWNKEITI